MSGKNIYSPLKQLSVLMALATGGTVAEAAAFFARLLPGAASLPANALLYALWAAGALRTLSWTLTLVFLSRLSNLRKSFRKAQIWYLLRIFSVAVTPLSMRLVRLLAEPFPPLASGLVLANLGLALVSETFFLSMGSRAILLADAELLRAFGMEGPAEKNRLCADRLMWCASALTLFLVFALVAALELRFVGGISLFAGGTTGGAASVLERAVIAFSLPMGLCVIALRFLASVRVSQTYRAIETLTE